MMTDITDVRNRNIEGLVNREMLRIRGCIDIDESKREKACIEDIFGDLVEEYGYKYVMENLDYYAGEFDSLIVDDNILSVGDDEQRELIYKNFEDVVEKYGYDDIKYRLDRFFISYDLSFRDYEQNEGEIIREIIL